MFFCRADVFAMGINQWELREGKLLRRLKYQPIISICIVAANVIIFTVCSLTGGLLYDYGGLNAFGVLARKEYGRILWSMFLHGDMSHLFNNMLLLFFLGSMIEKEMGHMRYAAVYFLSGIGGGLLSLLVKVMNHDPSGSIGASGAIFGLDGALLALVLFSGRRVENLSPARVLFMIAYSLYNGFVGDHIDNAAHVGGLITGFVVTGLLCIPLRRRDRRVSRRF